MRISAVVAVTLAVAATSARAQPIVVADSGDSAWVMATSLLALIAVLPGLTLFYGRGRPAPTGLALFGSIAIASLLFAVIGYSIAFASGSPYLGSASNAMLGNLTDLIDGLTISEPVYVFFQLAMALFAVGILCASLAGQSRQMWLIPFCGLWSLLVYAPVARWVSVGWLGDLGVIDTAGALSVQVAAGVAALVAALLLRAPQSTEVESESSLMVTGAGLVWVGFLALLGAAALGGSDDAANAILNGHFAASAAVVIGMAIERSLHGRVTVQAMTANAIAGLAAVMAGAALIGTGGAIALGAFGAAASSIAGIAVGRAKLGSAATAFTIHGAPAMAGALVLPVALHPALGGPGFVEGTGFLAQAAVQAIAVITVALWAAVATVIAALLVSVVAPIRIVQP